eukprot:5831616-Amphidinium_carterae.2
MFHSPTSRRQCGGHVRTQASLQLEKQAKRSCTHSWRIHSTATRREIGALEWKSTRQSLISKSSCESELLALVSGAELVEIMGLYSAESNCCSNVYEASTDNTACLTLLQAQRPTFRTRHISVRGEWLRLWQQQKMALSFVPSTKQVADALTKGMIISDEWHDTLDKALPGSVDSIGGGKQ